MAQEEKSDRERWQHLADLADFALAMKDTLTNINNQSFNNFMLRIGKGFRLVCSSMCSSDTRDSAHQEERGLSPEAFRSRKATWSQLWDLRDLFQMFRPHI